MACGCDFQCNCDYMLLYAGTLADVEPRTFCKACEANARADVLRVQFGELHKVIDGLLCGAEDSALHVEMLGRMRTVLGLQGVVLELSSTTAGLTRTTVLEQVTSQLKQVHHGQGWIHSIVDQVFN